jgi:ribosomal-protein-alanine N-acetyltransferase
MFAEFPNIDLGRGLRLRQLLESDTPEFWHYMSDRRVTTFIADIDVPKSLDGAREELMYWANLHVSGRSIYWAIVNDDNKLIGMCGFNAWNKYHKRAEVSYDLSYDYWGKGVMSSALQAITDYAFSKLQVKRVQATVAHNNPGSIKVLEKCGYKREGLLIKFGVLNGESTDYYMYAATI